MAFPVRKAIIEGCNGSAETLFGPGKKRYFAVDFCVGTASLDHHSTKQPARIISNLRGKHRDPMPAG